MTDDPCLLSAAEAGRRIAARRLSPVAYVEALLARIAAVEDRVHAYITVLAEPALAAARHAEAEIAAGRWRGPLHGVPFAVKDNYFTAGVRTTAGSRLMLDFVPDSTAPIIARLEAAGAILLGKLNTWEYGTGNGGVYFDLPFAPARNPWDLARFTGGSSTGAGASVAAGIAPFALGSDTGGSIRLPAAACGLAGLKATYGRVSRAGVLPNCWSLDVTGALCWTAEDSALVLNVIAGHDPADPGSATEPVPDYRAGLHSGVAGLTIGLVTAEGVTPSIAAGITEAAAVLERLGARLVEASLPAPLADYRRAASLINWSESLSIHEADFRDRASLMGQALRDKMTSGSLVRAADYLAAQRLRRQLARATDAIFGGCDLLLLPGAFRVAPRLDDAADTMAFTRESAMNVANLSGHPAMSVLTGFDPAGLPLNAQLMGRHFDEATVLRAAAALEAATRTAPAARRFEAPAMPEPSLEEIAAFAARHGLAALTPAQLARMAELASSVAETAAGLPRVTDKFVEPMPVFRVRG